MNAVLIRPYVDCVYVWGARVLRGAVNVPSGHVWCRIKDER